MPPATATAAAPAKGVKKSAPAAAAGAAATPAAQAAAEQTKNKNRVSMDEDEIRAAVEGYLAVREERGTPDQEALTAKSGNGRNAGRPIGVTTGLPILGAWCFVFQQNEKAPNRAFRNGDRPGDGKMTDEQISAWMHDEFPGRESPAFDHPQGCRRDYNSGKFTKEFKPKTPSQRYGPDAQPMPAGASRAKKNEGAPAAAPAAATPAGSAPAAAKKAAGKKPVTATA